MISCEMFCGNSEYMMVSSDTVFDYLGEPELQSPQIETSSRVLQKMTGDQTASEKREYENR